VTEPAWLTPQIVIAIQSQQLAIFGGGTGMRDENMLASALDRPRNQWTYGEHDLHALAAAYAFGIAKNHPFVDGNKRTAFLTAYTFLLLNGLEFDAEEADAAVHILALAAGELSEAELTSWIKRVTKVAG
jgi:death on curing protein